MAASCGLPPGSFDVLELEAALDQAEPGSRKGLEVRYARAVAALLASTPIPPTPGNTRANSTAVFANTTGFANLLLNIEQQIAALGG